MRSCRRLRSSLTCLLAATLAACSDGVAGPDSACRGDISRDHVDCAGDVSPPLPGPGPTPIPPPVDDPGPHRDDHTWVRLVSERGDVVGGGGTYDYTRANAQITMTPWNQRRVVLRVDGDELWFGRFQAPDSLARLTRGTYAGLEGPPLRDPAKAGLEWWGGIFCRTVTGSFTVHTIEFVGDSASLLDLSFEQHCDGDAAALRGRIRWNGADTTQPPRPINPVPPELWQPPPGATPVTGNYAYLESDSGEPIFEGRTTLYTDPASPVVVYGSGGAIATVNVAGWVGVFAGSYALPRLEPGYYPGLKRYPFHNPARGGLGWSGNGVGCLYVTGWFAVDRVTHANDRVTALELRFEHHCNGLPPALRGKVRWAAPNP